MFRMNSPRTRAEFEHNLGLLHRKIADGKFHVARGISPFFLEGLARVRYLPNGRIDFLSVDESTRLQANTTAQYSEEFLKEHFKNKGESDISPNVGDADVSPGV